MTLVRAIKLDVTRVGGVLLYKVTSLEEAGSAIETSEYQQARYPNGSAEALVEANAVASRWCQEHELQSFTMVDHRIESGLSYGDLNREPSPLQPPTIVHLTEPANDDVTDD